MVTSNFNIYNAQTGNIVVTKKLYKIFSGTKCFKNINNTQTYIFNYNQSNGIEIKQILES